MTQTTASQAIRNAIESERESARFYQSLAERTPLPAARSFLREMAGIELVHAAEIERIGKALFGDSLPDQADSDVSMVEALPEWKDAETLKLPESVQMAIAAEHGAALYYSALAEQLPEPARDVFLRLARTEEAHAASLVEHRDKLFGGH